MGVISAPRQPLAATGRLHCDRGRLRVRPPRAYNWSMVTNRIVVDLGPDERARLDAESRRRGVAAGAVITQLVRALPDPGSHGDTLAVLARLRDLRAGMSRVSEAEIDAALAESRDELERRARLDSRE